MGGGVRLLALISDTFKIIIKYVCMTLKDSLLLKTANYFSSQCKNSEIAANYSRISKITLKAFYMYTVVLTHC